MNVIDEIKDRLDLVTIVERDIRLERASGHYVGCCPFHSEKTASLHVWSDHYHCFGCGAHGDVFTYVQTTKNLDFKEALRELAREAGVTLREDPETAKRREQHLSRVAILRKVADVYHELLARNQDALDYLHRRGFTDAFISDYRIGWAPGDVLPCAGLSVSELQDVGLLNRAVQDYFRSRIIFPVWGRYADEIVDLVGRVFPDESERKYLKLPGPLTLINERGLRGQRTVYLCEGDTDTATLVQAGLPAVGVRGVHGLKDEFVSAFDRVETIYVCADADEAGLQLVRRAGEVFGNRAHVVMLPDGEDVNSYVGQQGHDLAALAAAAPTYLDWLIGHIPAEITPEEIDRQVKLFIPVLLTLGKGAQEAYAKRVARALGITVGPVREEMREALDARKNGHANGHQDVAVLNQAAIIWQDKTLINPAQALVDDAMMTVVFLDKLVTDQDSGVQKIVQLPHVITSRREVIELDEATMYARGLRFAPSKVPTASVLGQRWSVADSPHSVKQYVDGGVSVSPTDVYSEVVSYFQRYLFYPNPFYHDFLALWTIGTYFFELFPAYPYVHLVGTKRCGKTLTLDIIADLAFNAVVGTSLSSAGAYRTVESCSATLLLDEAENLQRREKNDEPDDKIEILKAGYKRGARVIRCAGDNHEPTGYEVYSPKIFGSIHSIDRILADRVITLTLARKRPDVKLDEFRPSEIASVLHRTRDKLYVLMLEYGREIAERFRDGIGWDGVTDRDRELWTPILTLAEFFDDALIEEKGEQNVDPRDFLTYRMRRMAQDTVVDRIARDRLEQTEVLVIEAVLEYLEQPTSVPVVEDFYATKPLFEFIQAHEGLEWMKSIRQVYAELERTTAINKSKDLAQKRPKGADHSTKLVRCIRLNRVRIEDVAKRLGARIPSSSDEHP